MAPKQKKPLLDEKSKDLATLSTLRRSDPHVTEILGTASHVTLYGFDIDISAWSRKNVEGSLFVVRRSVEPIFQFVVLNRLSAENTVENLLGDFEFERSPPYLLYKNETEVNGIWFYKQEECDAMSELFNKITNAFGPKAPHTGMSVETACHDGTRHGAGECGAGAGTRGARARGSARAGGGPTGRQRRRVLRRGFFRGRGVERDKRGAARIRRACARSSRGGCARRAQRKSASEEGKGKDGFRR